MVFELDSIPVNDHSIAAKLRGFASQIWFELAICFGFWVKILLGS